jgi:hypothetical protein
MTQQTKQVLIAVKAYPNPSRKYGETVCVAGVDISTHKWIRLYPIPYRDLDNEKKFAKYSLIEVKVRKATDDTRPESYKVDTGSIKILDQLDPKNNWGKRKPLILPTVSPSYCAILEESKQNNKSLGMFKPERVQFSFVKAPSKDTEKRESCYAQVDFLNKQQKRAIEDIPFDFRYSFYCGGKADCPGHDLAIIDWEINQSFRRWRSKYKTEAELLEKIKQRWFNSMCSEVHDTYFFVGNMSRFRKIFMVLGTFYPKIEK